MTQNSETGSAVPTRKSSHNGPSDQAPLKQASWKDHQVILAFGGTILIQAIVTLGGHFLIVSDGLESLEDRATQLWKDLDDKADQIFFELAGGGIDAGAIVPAGDGTAEAD